MTGTDLKAWRNRVGWTQQYLAGRLKVRVMTLSFWETGRTYPEGLPAETVRKITQVARKSGVTLPKGAK